MRKIFLIGIGPGDPDQLTVAAVRAMNAVDVFIVVDKGEAKQELVALRETVLARHVARQDYRVATVSDPARDRRAADYVGAVGDWRSARVAAFERVIAEQVGDDEVAAFLVWGDPSLYDSTLGIVAELLAAGRVEFDYEVIPGVSAVSALVARHRIALNRVSRPVAITPGRRLAEVLGSGIDDVVVMLDAHGEFAARDEPDLYIYWGAYVGTEQEILISGPVAEVAERILRVRARARERHGWIMDTYLLRRRPG
ncbi:MAG: precorrin-6A synthase (deacetylating) [Sciscionella sp.]